MTPDQFATALGRCNKQFQTGRKAGAARRVLVDGLGKAEAARESGLLPSAVWDAVARIEREHKSILGAPPGWECYTACVPRFSQAADDIREAEKRAWREAGLIKS